MSNYSSSKRLQNDIASHEENSDRHISPDMYYVVSIRLGATVLEDANINTFVKNMLKTRKTHRALVAYVYENEIHLLFSSVEGREHYAKGSHHAVCSEYASLLAMEFECMVDVKITELESRTLILIYFQTKVYDNAKKSAQKLSNGNITKKEISQFTFGETIPALRDRCGVIWDKIPPGTRFGTFYKYECEPKEKFIVISEFINPQDMDKYTSYFFE